MSFVYSQGIKAAFYLVFHLFIFFPVCWDVRVWPSCLTLWYIAVCGMFLFDFMLYSLHLRQSAAAPFSTVVFCGLSFLLFVVSLPG